jgi:uncharacterized delta-60 repeat protein
VSGSSSLEVLALAIQQNGKVLVVGDFTQFAGVACGGVIRLNVDGTVDTSFNTGTGAQSPDTFSNIDGPAPVMQLAIQPGGKIVVAGPFASFNGVPRRSVAVLNPDGSLDPSFDLGAGLTDDNGNLWPIEAMALEANGDILLGGDFTRAQSYPVNGLVRINGGLAGGVITSLDPGSGILELATRPGSTHSLEVSPGFGFWSGVSTNTASGLVLQFKGVATPSSAQRFYRARRLTP